MSEASFKLGDVVRHRISGTLAVIESYASFEPSGRGYCIDFGNGEKPLRYLYEVAHATFDHDGHARDAKYDPPGEKEEHDWPSGDGPEEYSMFGTMRTEKAEDVERQYSLPPGTLTKRKLTLPDSGPSPAMPRRFRWKHAVHGGPRNGLYSPGAKEPWYIQTDSNNWQHAPGFMWETCITEWIDPQPEGVT